jgi:hypothetical protein
MKIVVLPALTCVFILALVMAADAMHVGGPKYLRFFVCGAAGSMLAQLVHGVIARHLRSRRETA